MDAAERWRCQGDGHVTSLEVSQLPVAAAGRLVSFNVSLTVIAGNLTFRRMLRSNTSPLLCCNVRRRWRLRRVRRTDGRRETFSVCPPESCVSLCTKLFHKKTYLLQKRRMIFATSLVDRPPLDSAVSRTAVLQCGTVCPQPCAKTCHWLHLRQTWKRIFSAVHNDSWRPPGAVAAVSRFRRRDISDFT